MMWQYLLQQQAAWRFIICKQGDTGVAEVVQSSVFGSFTKRYKQVGLLFEEKLSPKGLSLQFLSIFRGNFSLIAQLLPYLLHKILVSARKLQFLGQLK